MEGMKVPVRLLRPPGSASPLHDARTATVVGRLLGPALAVCLVTGVVSHYLKHPPGPLLDVLPTRPVWGYRLSQGLHVASGTAAVPLLLAKLWVVYPRLFTWPPVRSLLHALERLSVALLVASAVFEVFSGLLNTAQWYPWPFSFVPVHFAVAWLLAGAVLLHLAVKAPVVAAHWRRHRAGAAPADPDARDRRSFLAGLGAAAAAVTVTTVGQSLTPLAPLDLLAPRHPGHGEQQLPVNRTAEAAGTAALDAGSWHLTVSGPRPCRLSLDQLRAMPQHEVELPIACVEGWSKSARWTGVRVADLLDRVAAPPGSRVRVTSLQTHGPYRVSELPPTHARDPLTLLALTLNGQPLSPDHGFPARIIAPNRPGVLQTKWVGLLEVS
ncbi:molybdopterin-dependent oxidoreductase [Streptomyces sp. NPDC059740]|uniref:molybdopterin-dependent oxidoreductase n=1 Tax=Streptomyces sp. NPDC059740 TaxID=3346926 RepID=UPI0036573541